MGRKAERRRVARCWAPVLSHSSLSTARGPWPASPSTEAASPSCVHGGPCPATATVLMPRPAQTGKAWPGLFAPWRPAGQLRLQLTVGHDLLVLRLLGPSPLRPVQART